MIFLERIFNRERMKMEVLAQPLVEVICGVFVGSLDVDPKQARLVLDRLIDLRQGPVGMKNARAVAIAEANFRFTGLYFGGRRRSMSPPPERAGSSYFPRSLGIRSFAGRLGGLETDRFVNDVDHDRLGRLGGDGTANR